MINSQLSLSGDGDSLKLSPKALRRLFAMQAFARENQQRFATLSVREKEILSLICQGMTNEEIAAHLYRSTNTIRTHRNNIWRRLEIRTVVEAVWWGECFDLI